MEFNKEKIMVQRLKTAKEGWLWVFKTLYMIIGFPCAVIITIPSLIMAPSLIHDHAYSTLLFFAVIWLGVLIPIMMFTNGVSSKRRLLERMTKVIKNPQFFDPDVSNEIYHEGDGKYFGIDTKNGTILYIHRIRKGQVDVLAMTMEDWTNREVEGKGILRLYTKHPDLPRIQIGTPYAQRWYDSLGAMGHKSYSTPQRFDLYVTKYLEKLERDNKIYIPRWA